jgi:hypothetical protein
VQKSNFQEKSWKILQNSYFTRRPMEPEDEGWEPGSPPGGAAQAWPRQGVVRPPQPPPQALLSPTYTIRPETIEGSAFFPDRLLLCRHHQKLQFGTRNSVLAPCQDGDLEEIFITPSPTSLHQPSMTPHPCVSNSRCRRRGW